MKMRPAARIVGKRAVFHAPIDLCEECAQMKRAREVYINGDTAGTGTVYSFNEQGSYKV